VINLAHALGIRGKRVLVIGDIAAGLTADNSTQDLFRHLGLFNPRKVPSP
jgi:hypothetical protein